MDTEKHLDAAILIYLFILLLFVGINLINKVNIFDVMYLVVVVCCVLKYFIIICNNRK